MRLAGIGYRFRRWMAGAAIGLTMYQLSGCDPAVRDAVFSGVESATIGLATSFLQALFLVLRPEEETTTTVRAIFDQAAALLC